MKLGWASLALWALLFEPTEKSADTFENCVQNILNMYSSCKNIKNSSKKSSFIVQELDMNCIWIDLEHLKVHFTNV